MVFRICSTFILRNVSKSKVAQLELQSWEQQKLNEEQKREQFIQQKERISKSTRSYKLLPIWKKVIG
jgi:hypothetical protein